MKSTKKRDLIIAIAVIIIVNSCIFGVLYFVPDKPDQNINTKAVDKPVENIAAKTQDNSVEFQSTLSPDSPFAPHNCCNLAGIATDTRYKYWGNQ
ncbi:MAG: hypothetical protein HQK91_14205, partial [Nitrospirae bacterium]|nr:hypothetical protein [Nitrospirota bacterium]